MSKNKKGNSSSKMLDIFINQAVPESHEFKFECAADCWSKCCAKYSIILNPFDIDAISQFLGISTTAFIDTYCKTYVGKNSLFPIVSLITSPRCVFNINGPCKIYSVRPVVCRLYPVGRGIIVNTKTNEEQEKFILEKCKGMGKGKAYTIKSFLESQDAYKYLKITKAWLDIIKEWHEKIDEQRRKNLIPIAATIAYFDRGKIKTPEQLLEERVRDLQALTKTLRNPV